MNKKSDRSGRHIPPHSRGATMLAWVGAALFLFLLPTRGAGLASGPPAPTESGVPEMTMEQRYGIKVIGVHLTAAGYMLDFRFRVIDPPGQGICLTTRSSPA